MFKNLLFERIYKLLLLLRCNLLGWSAGSVGVHPAGGTGWKPIDSLSLWAAKGFQKNELRVGNSSQTDKEL